MQLGKKIRDKLQNTLRLLPALRLVWQSSPGWTIARVVLLTIQGILPVISIYLSKLIIDAVAANLSLADKAAAFRNVLVLIAIAGGVTLLTTLANSLTELVTTAHSQRVTDYMQGIINAKSIEADLEYYENSLYYDTLQRAQQEAPYRPPQILNRLAQIGQNSISLVAMIGLLLTLHWGILGVLFVAALPAMLVRVKYSRIMYDWQRKWTPMQRQGFYLAWMLTSDQFAKEIRLFDLGHYFSNWYLRIRRQIYKESLKIFTRRFIANFAAEAIAGILIFAIYALIIYQAINGVLRLGDLVLYYQALQRGQNDIKSLLANISALYEDNLFLGNLYEFLDLKPRLIDPVNAKPIPRPMQTGIVFHDVSFQYSTTTRQALHHINLNIKPGEVVALVGENGSGKTTLIKLLCRLYDPTAGSITIDGVDIRDYKIAELRRDISVIFQDYAKYNFTAQENIWLANIELPANRESIMTAARRSGADDVITKLPKGYDTILGKLFDQGEELSIGQWQKIALARAFLRDSQLIVLDEPTSAMDPKAEYEVFEKFRQLIQNQAAILISHRLSTVKMADRIYVMENGTIMESGTHDELIKLGSRYAYLYETQAKQYR
ncbi:ABC transporter, ATP-binding/permease protein [Nostoc sp. HK-01]|uniref:ABC transporter, ATP-binding/permease protein n=2 Tax=Nostocales TaxID=1161 RepID=A0A1Z4GFN5_9CYAN|nr:ABC transporter ATP-binding protein [Nostoc cycadae]BAY16330.1 ABC transporter, ATP-binding/permease protein [Anabaenopsis circularis NIES-21]BBD59601.1 ABC transporter, ATP-binding/permease protein [Nostoc sp. HK-01]GBE94175.1 xenobiotic-transporting ATPase [Nostoc cycadae WK-1]